MKLKNVFLLTLMVTVLMISCSPNKDENPTKVMLDKTTLSIEVGKTATLTATVEPKGSKAAVVWTSLNPEVASVSDGVVTGVKEGSTTITASAGAQVAVCAVTVVKEGTNVDPDPDPNTSESLKGSNYYVLFMDETTYSSISSKVVADLRIDDSSAVMDIWPAGESYSAVDPSGPNFYGQVSGWISLKSTNFWAGTGGGGIRQMKNFDLSKIDGTYTFHCAYKSKDGGKNEICLFHQDGKETWFTLPAATDGEWKEYEISMSTIIAQGWNFSVPYVYSGDGRYSLGFRSSPLNTHLNLDAVFIYKK